MPSFSFNVGQAIEMPSDNKSADYEVVPAGRYSAMVSDSAIKKTKAGDGEYIELTWEIVGGPHNNRKWWQMYQVKNKSEKAVSMAQADLSAICKAMGREGFDMTEDLHNHEIVVDLEIESQAGWSDKNRVPFMGYHSASAAPAAPAAPAPTPPPAQPVAAEADIPSWQREWPDDEVK
ncbi:MAG: DUF669 domain-containing protein [Luminiphilus sp.]|nr:DUF669 domain-containing protein [Luminiphilus sp.]